MQYAAAAGGCETDVLLEAARLSPDTLDATLAALHSVYLFYLPDDQVAEEALPLLV